MPVIPFANYSIWDPVPHDPTSLVCEHNERLIRSEVVPPKGQKQAMVVVPVALIGVGVILLVCLSAPYSSKSALMYIAALIGLAFVPYFILWGRAAGTTSRSIDTDLVARESRVVYWTDTSARNDIEIDLSLTPLRCGEVNVHDSGAVRRLSWRGYAVMTDTKPPYFLLATATRDELQALIDQCKAHGIRVDAPTKEPVLTRGFVIAPNT